MLECLHFFPIVGFLFDDELMPQLWLVRFFSVWHHPVSSVFQKNAQAFKDNSSYICTAKNF